MLFLSFSFYWDVSNGDHSQDVLTQPADTSISSFRQFEPILKFHGTKAFNDETITFQSLRGGLPYTEKTELESCVYNYAKDNDIKEDSFKEENPVGNSTSTNKDWLAHECVRQPLRSPPLICCGGETLQFTEMSLAKNTAEESALNLSEPHSRLCKECVHSDVENPFFYTDKNFNLLDLRANYRTKEVRFLMVSRILKDVFF